MQKLSKSVCLSSPAIEFIIPLNSKHLWTGFQLELSPPPSRRRSNKRWPSSSKRLHLLHVHRGCRRRSYLGAVGAVGAVHSDDSNNLQLIAVSTSMAELFHRAAGLVFQFWRTSGWLSVVYNTTAAIANRQTIARLSCSKNCWQLLQWLQAKGIGKSYLTNPGRLYQRGFHAHNLVCNQGMKIPPWRGIPDSGNLTPLQFFYDLPLRTLM